METIVMIPGMWAGPWCFEKYAGYFEEKGYNCVTPDLLYHDVAPSDPPPPQLATATANDYVDHLEALIRSLPEAPIILGHSMGGLLAQKLAERGLGKAVILLTPAAPAGILALRWSVILSFQEALLRWGFWRKPFRPSFATMAYSVFNNTPVEDQKLYYEKMVHESGKLIFEIGFWLVDLARGAAVDETKVTAPTLVVGAKLDRITPAAVVRNVAAKYAHVADYHEFPNHAHLVISEPGWENVAGHVLDWLKGKGL